MSLLDTRTPQLVRHEDQHDQTQRHEEPTGGAEVGARVAPAIETANRPRDEGVECWVAVGCRHVGAGFRTAHSIPTRDSAGGGDLLPEMSRHRERTLAGCGRHRFLATRQNPPASAGAGGSGAAHERRSTARSRSGCAGLTGESWHLKG